MDLVIWFKARRRAARFVNDALRVTNISTTLPPRKLKRMRATLWFRGKSANQLI